MFVRSRFMKEVQPYMYIWLIAYEVNINIT